VVREMGERDLPGCVGRPIGGVGQGVRRFSGCVAAWNCGAFCHPRQEQLRANLTLHSLYPLRARRLPLQPYSYRHHAGRAIRLDSPRRARQGVPASKGPLGRSSTWVWTGRGDSGREARSGLSRGRSNTWCERAAHGCFSKKFIITTRLNDRWPPRHRPAPKSRGMGKPGFGFGRARRAGERAGVLGVPGSWPDVLAGVVMTCCRAGWPERGVPSGSATERRSF
jgi:hypothetical protein